MAEPTSYKLTDSRDLSSIQFVRQERGLLASLGLPAVGDWRRVVGSVRGPPRPPSLGQEADQLLRLVLTGHALHHGAGDQLGGN